MASSLRLFFALWPDAVTRRALADWAEAVHQACGGRRTRPENLHATLAFLGAIDPPQVASLGEAAGRVAVPPFELLIDRPGYWKKNRIAWAGATTLPIALTALADALRTELTALGFRFDPKPFAPHITLARDAAPPGPMAALPPVHWAVNDFSLVVSPGGQAAYQVIRSWPLLPG